jgi:hypothetical protein
VHVHQIRTADAQARRELRRESQRQEWSRRTLAPETRGHRDVIRLQLELGRERRLEETEDIGGNAAVGHCRRRTDVQDAGDWRRTPPAPLAGGRAGRSLPAFVVPVTTRLRRPRRFSRLAAVFHKGVCVWFRCRTQSPRPTRAWR